MNTITDFINNIKNLIPEELKGLFTVGQISILAVLGPIISILISKFIKILKNRFIIDKERPEYEDDLKYYISSYGQKEDPCMYDEPRNGISENRIKLVPFFLKRVFKGKGNNKRCYLILSDSGMGKSTFLEKLYTKYKKHISLFRHYNIVLYSLTNGTPLKEIQDRGQEERKKTVLLLDSLDEDPYVLNNYEEQINKIMEAIDCYYKVVITSRSQLFPDQKNELSKTRKMEMGTKGKARTFEKYYLSPFSDREVHLYLLKRYKIHFRKIHKAKKIVKISPDIMARPMILDNIDILLNKQKECGNLKLDICSIYQIIVDAWIERETCYMIDEDIIRKFCNKAAVYMLLNDKLLINTSEIDTICTEDDKRYLESKPAKVRTLLNRNTSGWYKFAHKSIFEYIISTIAIEDTIDNEDYKIRRKLLEKINARQISGIYYQQLSYNKVHSGANDLSYLLLNTADLNRKSFDNANLKRMDFGYRELVGADFRNAELEGAKFYAANLRKSNFSMAVLEDAQFQFAKLHDAILYGAKLNKAKLHYTELYRADLRDADLSECVFQETVFDKVKLNRTSFETIIASQSKSVLKLLHKISMQGTTLRGIDLKTLVSDGLNLYSWDLSGSNLAVMDLSGININHVFFRNATMYQADLRYANLPAVDFTGANLVWAKFQGAKLDKANFTNTKLYRASFVGTDLRRIESFKGANITGADFSRAIYSRSQFIGAIYKDIELRREYLNNVNLFVNGNYKGNRATEIHYEFLKEHDLLDEVIQIYEKQSIK